MHYDKKYYYFYICTISFILVKCLSSFYLEFIPFLNFFTYLLFFLIFLFISVPFNFQFFSVSFVSFTFSSAFFLLTGLMADAANSAGDLLIDAVVFYTIKEARKKATPERPWGRGKIEPLGALTIGGVLLATGGGN